MSYFQQRWWLAFIYRAYMKSYSLAGVPSPLRQLPSKANSCHTHGWSRVWPAFVTCRWYPYRKQLNALITGVWRQQRRIQSFLNLKKNKAQWSILNGLNNRLLTTRRILHILSQFLANLTLRLTGSSYLLSTVNLWIHKGHGKRTPSWAIRQRSVKHTTS
jgi:hypothetical protein